MHDTRSIWSNCCAPGNTKFKSTGVQGWNLIAFTLLLWSEIIWSLMCSSTKGNAWSRKELQSQRERADLFGEFLFKMRSHMGGRGQQTQSNQLDNSCCVYFHLQRLAEAEKDDQFEVTLRQWCPQGCRNLPEAAGTCGNSAAACWSETHLFSLKSKLHRVLRKCQSYQRKKGQ